MEDPREFVRALQEALFSGQGLLDARALWASIVGPARLAVSQSAVVRLRPDQPEQLYKNLAGANVYVYLGVSLPGGALVATLGTLLSNSSNLGSNNSAPAVLVQSMISGNFFTTGFAQLLLPGEELYAQINDAAFPVGTSQNVVVATAIF